MLGKFKELGVWGFGFRVLGFWGPARAHMFRPKGARGSMQWSSAGACMATVLKFGV